MAEGDKPRSSNQSKLSEAMVREIRAMAGKPCPMCDAKPSLRSLAKKFNVTAPSILAVIERRTYSRLADGTHVPDRRAADRSMDSELRATSDLLRKHEIGFETVEMLEFATRAIAAARSEETRRDDCLAVRVQPALGNSREHGARPKREEMPLPPG